MRMETNNLDQKESYIPHGLLLQRYITERFSLPCALWCQNDYSAWELRFQDMPKVAHLLGGN